MNFIYIFPTGARASLLKSMIVARATPSASFVALGENIARYEAQFGTIKEMPKAARPNVLCAVSQKLQLSTCCEEKPAVLKF